MAKSKSVLLGFSGGIDSTAAAAILREEGYDVHLDTLDTTGDPELLQRARETARKLGLPWHCSDVRERFRSEIIDYFIDGYRRGETPAPCTRCNPLIKWESLFRTATACGYDHIATGHYFRIHREGNTRFVRMAADPAKDQSYYLWWVPQACLSMALTPMGDRFKSEVKTRYCNGGLQRESMGVCFLEGRSYRQLLSEKLPQLEPGEIVDREGHVVGCHGGYAYYTIGQKRGLETSLPNVAVVAIDVRRNRVIVGNDSELLHRTLIVRESRLPDPHRLFDSPDIRVKIRGIGRNPEGFASIRPDGHERLHVELTDAAWAPAKGQPVVFYQNELVLGGGILEDYRP